MDKYEYKIRSEEIKTLIAKGEYVEAAVIADTIDWRRVKSVMMLCTISDLYKINRRFEDARDMLLLAYDRHPGGRSIVYSLCELSIKMGEFVPAVEYYKEFVQVAPKDTGRYVLQYKLYEAQEVSLEERIAVLEELKAKDYSEKWAYELAYLYHRIGLGTKCVEECDELILWFGEGKYVLKAMELKMLHEPLIPEQQMKYDQMKGIGQVKPQAEAEGEASAEAENVMDAPTKEIPVEELDIQVKPMNVGQYDTINMQKELAQNMRELWEGPGPEEPAAKNEPEEKEAQTIIMEPVSDKAKVPSVLEETDADIIDLPDEDTEEEPVEPEETKVEEVFFGETGEMDTTAAQIMEEMKKETLKPEQKEEPVSEEKESISEPEKKEEPKPSMPAKFEKILGMEYDGQISMVMPESEQVEKQITGQIRLEDVLLEWEKMKKDSEQKRMEAVRQHVMEQTGAMFTEFEAAARDGLLEKLEKGNADVDLPDAEDITEDTTEEIVEDIAENIPEETEEDITEDVSEEIEEDTAEAAFEEPEEETIEDMTEDISEEEEEDTAEAAFEEPEEETIEDMTEDISEKEEEDTAEATFEEPEETEEAATEDISEETEDVPEDFDDAAAEETAYIADSEEEGVEELEDIDEEPEEADEEPEETEEEIEETEEEIEETEEEIEETDEEIEETEETEETDEMDEPEETDAEVTEESAETWEEEEEPEEADEEASEADESEDEEGEPEESSGKKGKVRHLSPEEKQLFGAYIQTKKTREQIVYAIDNISMAAYTGNVIITGEEGMDTMTLAKNLIREVQQTDSNFSGKIAKISAESLNKKDISQVFDKLANGALIVQKAGGLKKTAIEQMRSGLETESTGLIVVLEDVRTSMNKLIKHNPTLTECFNIRIDIEALDNDSLVAFGKKYAREQEYSIDDLGVLALHTCIAERQTSDHAVTISEVKEIVDDAIYHANRKTFGHFIDILVAKRYDDEDMIILREKDFI